MSRLNRALEDSFDPFSAEPEGRTRLRRLGSLERSPLDYEEEEFANDTRPHILINGKRFYEIPNNQGYYISRDGRVYSQRLGRELSVNYSTSGYRQVSVNGRNRLIHRLMWETFNGPIPPRMTINHINTIRDDNRLKNLELVTHRENCNKRHNHRHVLHLPSNAIEFNIPYGRTSLNLYYNGFDIYLQLSNCYRVIPRSRNRAATINGTRVYMPTLYRILDRIYYDRFNNYSDWEYEEYEEEEYDE